MASAETPGFFVESIVFLGAAVVAVPLAKRLGVGSIIGYLFAGIVIGPFGMGLIQSVKDILPLAELGVVLLLFVLGLELSPNRLWRMKTDIFGLGLSQILLTGLVLMVVMQLFGLPRNLAIIGAFGMALSSTAFAVQTLKDHGHFSSDYGQRAFGILLMQDIAIVPLLALVNILMPGVDKGAGDSVYEQVGITIVAVLIVIVVGRYLLSALFSFLANSHAREIMLAAALLVALGSAGIMHWAGLSMALGAFLAGIMLAESSFRHTLEADIYPFRSLLMGLFFMAVGMQLDLGVTFDNLFIIITGVVVVMVIKGAILYLLSRVTGSPSEDAMRIAVSLPQAGEFAFVLFAAAASADFRSSQYMTVLSAIVILTMVMTPLAGKIFDHFHDKRQKETGEEEQQDFGPFEDESPHVLLVGFGRFGMVVAQMLMAEGLRLVAIDNNPGRIAVARKYGLPVYYGNAMRTDVMRAAGAEDAVLIALCIENEAIMATAIDQIRESFPKAAIFCRATDRAHAMRLTSKKVDYHIRETFESGIMFGRVALDRLGIPTDRINDIETDVREQDLELLVHQIKEGELKAAQSLQRKAEPRVIPRHRPDLPDVD